MQIRCTSSSRSRDSQSHGSPQTHRDPPRAIPVLPQGPLEASPGQGPKNPLEPPKSPGTPHSPQNSPTTPEHPLSPQPPPLPAPPPSVLNSCEQTHRSCAPSPGIWGALEFPQGGAGKRLPTTFHCFLGQNWDVVLFLGFFSSTLCQAHTTHGAGMFHPPRGALGPPKMKPPMTPLSLGIGANFLPSPGGFTPK